MQTFKPYATAAVVQTTEYDEPVTDKDGKPVLDAKGQPTTKKSKLTEQVLAVGPAASQIAIKQLGTNGGGFFNVNSAHPFENATPLSNFLELLSILVISAALCYTFGVMVGDTRQGWAVLAAMTVIFVVLLVVCAVAEQNGHTLVKQGVDHTASALSSGGNMEGKEVRFGIANSALWATATTSASNGSVNSMHDSYTPIGGLVPMWLMQLGEVVYGGVGSGLYGMIVFAIIAVFVAGLMVGRTPGVPGQEDRGVRDEDVLAGHPDPAGGGPDRHRHRHRHRPAARPARRTPAPTASARSCTRSRRPGTTTAARSRGSAPTRPSTTRRSASRCCSPATGWRCRPWRLPARWRGRRRCPSGPGTLPTHTPLFVGLLIGVVVLVGALTFVPALALGPIVEHLMLVAAK